MGEIVFIARRLREHGRVAAFSGNRSAAQVLYRLADRFERPIANNQEAVEKARELGALMVYETWAPEGGAA